MIETGVVDRCTSGTEYGIRADADDAIGRPDVMDLTVDQDCTGRTLVDCGWGNRLDLKSPDGDGSEIRDSLDKMRVWGKAPALKTDE